MDVKIGSWAEEVDLNLYLGKVALKKSGRVICIRSCSNIKAPKNISKMTMLSNSRTISSC